MRLQPLYKDKHMPPPNPSKIELLNWARNYDKLWSAGNRQGWIDSYRTVIAGDNVRMLDPVGTTEKFGFQHCMLDSYDLFQPNVIFHIPPETLFVNGNEVAWVMHNIITSGGKESVIPSIETYRFDPDGSLAVRTWYRMPHKDKAELGQMFKVYLPGDYKE